MHYIRQGTNNRLNTLEMKMKNIRMVERLAESFVEMFANVIK